MISAVCRLYNLIGVVGFFIANPYAHAESHQKSKIDSEAFMAVLVQHINKNDDEAVLRLIQGKDIGICAGRGSLAKMPDRIFYPFVSSLNRIKEVGDVVLDRNKFLDQIDFNIESMPNNASFKFFPFSACNKLSQDSFSQILYILAVDIQDVGAQKKCPKTSCYKFILSGLGKTRKEWDYIAFLTGLGWRVQPLWTYSIGPHRDASHDYGLSSLQVRAPPVRRPQILPGGGEVASITKSMFFKMSKATALAMQLPLPFFDSPVNDGTGEYSLPHDAEYVQICLSSYREQLNYESPRLDFSFLSESVPNNWRDIAKVIAAFRSDLIVQINEKMNSFVVQVPGKEFLYLFKPASECKDVLQAQSNAIILWLSLIPSHNPSCETSRCQSVLVKAQWREERSANLNIVRYEKKDSKVLNLPSLHMYLQ